MRFANDSDSCCKCFLVDLGYVFTEITKIGRKNDLVSESGESRASIRGEEILQQSV